MAVQEARRCAATPSNASVRVLLALDCDAHGARPDDSRGDGPIARIDDDAAQASEIMRAEDIHRVLVGSSEQLEGILTSFDLLRAV